MTRRMKQGSTPGTTRRTRKVGEKNKSLEERKKDLKNDLFAREFTSRSVVCAGCGKTIKTDARNAYYPGLWIKHRDKCKKVAVR